MGLLRKVSRDKGARDPQGAVEKQILADFLSGGEEGFHRFYKAYGGIAKSAIRDIGANCGDRRDLEQDIWAKLLDKDKKLIRDFRYRSRFSTYLYCVCRRIALQNAKVNKGTPALREAVLPPALLSEARDQTPAFDETDARALRLAIDDLSHDDRIFVRMTYFDKRSTEEIMRFFGWHSRNSVYSRRHKVIARLRQLMARKRGKPDG